MTKIDEYWSNFWREYSVDNLDIDEQTQVFRTRNQIPIDKEAWIFTLQSVQDQLELNDNDTLLDLCCGNGLFARAYSKIVKHVEAVDLSESLIKTINKNKISNVNAYFKDIRNIDYSKNRFSKILWYAGVQYIDEADIVLMLEKIRFWLQPGGILFIGDIPDREKLWLYFNNVDRIKSYFKAVASRRPIIGTWIERGWIERLCEANGFDLACAADQDKKLIYSDFRFDVIAR